MPARNGSIESLALVQPIEPFFGVVTIIAPDSSRIDDLFT
jgi:hypothetical protein